MKAVWVQASANADAVLCGYQNDEIVGYEFEAAWPPQRLIERGCILTEIDIPLPLGAANGSFGG